MTRRPVDHHAICCALAASAVAMGTIDATRSGYITAHSSTCIPPIEPPITLCQRRMPRWSARAAWLRTQSRTDTTGKRLPHGSPSSGCGLAGPVVPWQPPSTLAQTTNQRSVSIARPGPMSPSHQPGVGWPGASGPAAWLSPVRAWQTRTAFEASLARVPHVS